VELAFDKTQISAELKDTCKLTVQPMLTNLPLLLSRDAEHLLYVTRDYQLGLVLNVHPPESSKIFVDNRPLTANTIQV
jgi:hypothetical protein